ncbi:MAG TPA: alpha/beta hydrolase [Pseudomonadales bacterium]|nr:alpha/beta hydrolase [Pseudomonadales bacterium]
MMSFTAPEQIHFNVLGLKLAAQRWHEGGIPVIALHGWLDNSESFAPLAACMPTVDLVALDLAGHGWSDHRAAHAGYLIWDDLREILAVADALGWQRFGVLGHSRGAIIGALLAAAAPQRVAALGLIDGLWAKTCAADKMPVQMARSLQQEHDKPANSGQPVFLSLDDMVQMRVRSGFPLSEAAARQIVSRNTVQREGGWHWRTDPRHKLPSMVMLTPEQQYACHRAIAAPVELALASNGLVLAYPDFAERLLDLPHINWSLHDGNHHLHMEGMQSILGSLYNRFFQRL